MLSAAQGGSIPPAHLPPMPSAAVQVNAGGPVGVQAQAAPQVQGAGSPQPTATVTAATPPPPPINVPVTATDKGLSPTSLMKKVLENRGFEMKDIKGTPKVLSASEAAGGDKTVQLEYNEYKGKKFAKIPVVYEVTVEKTVFDASGNPTTETEVLRFEQDWYTNHELPTTWGGREEENFQTLIDEDFQRITSELQLIGHLASTLKEADRLPRQTVREAKTRLNFLRMTKSLTTGQLWQPTTHFGGRKVVYVPARMKQLYMGQETDPLTGEKVYLPRKVERKVHPVTKAVIYTARKPERPIVMAQTTPELAQLEERRLLLRQVQETPNATLDGIVDPNDRTFVAETLQNQCIEYLDDLNGVTGNPQESLLYYHPDLSESAIAMRKQSKETGATTYDDLHGRKAAADRDYQAGVDRSIAHKPLSSREELDHDLLAKTSKSYKLMEQRARATLLVCKEAHAGLKRNLTLLSDPSAPPLPQGPAITARARELEQQIQDLEAYINRCFSPPPAQPTTSASIGQPPSAPPPQPPQAQPPPQQPQSLPQQPQALPQQMQPQQQLAQPPLQQMQPQQQVAALSSPLEEPQIEQGVASKEPLQTGDSAVSFEQAREELAIESAQQIHEVAVPLMGQKREASQLSSLPPSEQVEPAAGDLSKPKNAEDEWIEGRVPVEKPPLST